MFRTKKYMITTLSQFLQVVFVLEFFSNLNLQTITKIKQTSNKKEDFCLIFL